MKLVSWFLFSLLIFSKTSLAIESRSSVEFQWEEDPKAAEYQVQILNQKGDVLKELKSSNNNFKVKMPVNIYKIRGRIKTKLGNLGPWSGETELVIPPSKVKVALDSIPAKGIVADPKTSTAKMHIKWFPSPQAKKYIFKLKDQAGKVLKEQEVTTPFIELFVTPGTYTFSITAVAPNGIASEETQSKEVLEVKATTLAKPKYKIELTPEGIPKLTFEKADYVSIQGELHHLLFLSENSQLVKKFEDFKDIIWQPEPGLKPGYYKVYFWATAKGSKDSEKIVETFIVKPKEADLQ